MNVALLTTAIVEQTMVLIAQLSTASGLRAPLAGIANQVFLDLVGELEGRGVSRKVVADMFGLALRSYQQKVQRLRESLSHRGITLWGAVYQHIADQGVVSRSRVLERFRHDDAASVKSILNDLVGSGLVYRTGRADATVYRSASRQEVKAALGSCDEQTAAALVWATVHARGPIERNALLEQTSLEPEALDRALGTLTQDGRILLSESAGERRYRAEALLLPAGQSAGWEAALIDHYRAVVGAMCAKLRLLGESSEASEANPTPQVGGSTFSFDVWQGHPHRERAQRLLERTRAELGAFWDEVRAHNTQVSRPAQYERVTFYFGQNVSTEDWQPEI